MPNKEAIHVIIQIVSKDTEIEQQTKLSIDEIKCLIELCLGDCYFLYENKLHKPDQLG